MTPHYHPSPVNGPFEDPGVYVDFLHERRALLFDLGDIRALPPRKILRISHVFVSHTHLDHFFGFDHLVRICLGRDRQLHLFGPAGFTDRVAHRLAAYTWNLVESFPADFALIATEIHRGGGGRTARFRCRRGFEREGDRSERFTDGIVLEEETLRVRAAVLDHGIDSIAYALEEKNHVNIMKNRLRDRGLPTGPWLRELKRQIVQGGADETPFRARWREDGVEVERAFTLGELKSDILQIVPGQKIAYVTDVADTPANRERIVQLAEGADYLFIEAMFLDEERERAGERRHLTARQAGRLAARAGVGRVVPFHFSPRYLGREDDLRDELARAVATDA